MLVLTALYLLNRIAMAWGGSYPLEEPWGWGIMDLIINTLSLVVNLYPGFRLAEVTRDWKAAVLATVLTSLGGWFGYTMVISILSAMLGAKEITIVFGLTTQRVIQTWTIGLAVSLIGGAVLGVVVGFLGVRRFNMRDRYR